MAIDRENQTRFVVLRHSTPAGVHWDLMIERGETLATWRLERAPSGDDEQAIAAEPIGDHRRDYLDYEGPVSGNRGRVDQHDAGTCRVITSGPDQWQIEFAGKHLTGAYSLCASRDIAGREAAAGGAAGGSGGASAKGLSSGYWSLRRLSPGR